MSKQSQHLQLLSAVQILFSDYLSLDMLFSTLIRQPLRRCFRHICMPELLIMVKMSATLYSTTGGRPMAASILLCCDSSIPAHCEGRWDSYFWKTTQVKHLVWKISRHKSRMYAMQMGRARPTKKAELHFHQLSMIPFSADTQVACSCTGSWAHHPLNTCFLPERLFIGGKFGERAGGESSSEEATVLIASW